ncbi:hypothetical protein SAMN04488021_11173 [Paracoccus aminovorans]|uniref:Uncharacterized protein n=1 Tax=Paracoccus aminovorans TaxID=34004 RepID=A0A1I2ZZC7_9RHOB|nr:hypothetical protein [Paracoccus aminovorans]CQR84445.1 hypothetical protein JCM7685_pAMV3p0500 [Paracoccus aminovorans]SFH42839.1 hypothetical protein SAMN04488021_11173 [Paracoccus aminovorans]
MSAPRTNIEKQKRHHLVPIIGIIAVVLIALAGFLWWFGDETNDPEIPGQTPGPADEIAAPPDATPAPAPDAPATDAAPGTATGTGQTQ